MAVALVDGAPTAIVNELERLLAIQDEFDEEFERIDFGSWASVHVYLPQPDIKSAITPPFMEAFLVLQKQLYQFAALAKTGIADIGQLGDGERDELLLSVIVSGGSSDYLADMKRPLLALLRRMVGKMSGKQSVIVIVSLAALITAGWSFNAWLDQTKAIKLEELKSKDHTEALRSLQFSNEEQSKAFNRVIEVLASQGEIGKRAIEVASQTNDALLRAATTNPKTRIKEVEITRAEAELLRTPSRKKATQKIIQQEVKVVDINTTDPLDLQIVLLDPSSEVQHRIRFKDDLFAGESRHKLFNALEKRSLLWVELAVKEVDGEIRSVSLLRTIGRPAGLDDEVANAK
ncbi:hypothetical protein KQX63_21370 [Rhodopseudomonas palustris]|uniref:hypothetical protein n=1 Tax=Rhodopseudomonas palustris TaxID=1076 RepID=UPI0021F30448|nr:hypothetical protein [Rhodopseudomonas palustris]UYO43895.1 hypothetical protein KQX63_21370 [Rhodopseudomonas palustris]